MGRRLGHFISRRLSASESTSGALAAFEDGQDIQHAQLLFIDIIIAYLYGHGHYYAIL